MQTRGVRHPRSARAGSRDRGGGHRGGALSAAAPPPAPRGGPSGRLGSALAREPARGPGPPAPTYRLLPEPRPPLRRARRSNMAARGAPEAPPASASGPFRRAAVTPAVTERVRPRPRPRPGPAPSPPPAAAAAAPLPRPRRFPAMAARAAGSPAAPPAPRRSRPLPSALLLALLVLLAGPLGGARGE